MILIQYIRNVDALNPCGVGHPEKHVRDILAIQLTQRYRAARGTKVHVGEKLRPLPRTHTKVALDYPRRPMTNCNKLHLARSGGHGKMHGQRAM